MTVTHEQKPEKLKEKEIQSGWMKGRKQEWINYEQIEERRLLF